MIGQLSKNFNPKPENQSRFLFDRIEWMIKIIDLRTLCGRSQILISSIKLLRALSMETSSFPELCPWEHLKLIGLERQNYLEQKVFLNTCFPQVGSCSRRGFFEDRCAQRLTFWTWRYQAKENNLHTLFFYCVYYVLSTIKGLTLDSEEIIFFKKHTTLGGKERFFF